LEIDVTDRYGNRLVRIKFDLDGKIKAVNGFNEVVLESYESGNWYELKVVVDAHPFGAFSISLNDKLVLSNARLAESVKSVERVSFRTGPYRFLPNRKTPNQEQLPPLVGADEPVKPSAFYIDDFRVTSK